MCVNSYNDSKNNEHNETVLFFPHSLTATVSPAEIHTHHTVDKRSQAHCFLAAFSRRFTSAFAGTIFEECVLSLIRSFDHMQPESINI